MACFLVPATEAVVTTVVQKVLERKQTREGETPKEGAARPWSERLSWLNTMLWGGSALLALEHIWHGEVVPWPPFLTAMRSPAETSAMLHEMGTVGVAMAVTVTLTWAAIVVVATLRSQEGRAFRTRSAK